MKRIITLILLSLTLTAWAETRTLVGKVVQSKKNQKYYMLIQIDDKKYAYPIDAEEKSVAPFKGKTVKLDFTPEFRKVDETAIRLHLKASKFTELTLSQMGVKKNEELSPGLYTKENSPLNSESLIADHPRNSFSISNKAANTAIFVGGAILAGSILSEMAAQ